MIQLEDQEFPKKCGRTPQRRAIPTEEMARKIAVAAEARASPDLLIIARTDARTSKGLPEGIHRARAYAVGGADKLLMANMLEGGRKPLLSNRRPAEIGFVLAIHPIAGVLSAAAALETAHRQIRDTGSSPGSRAPVHSFAEMSRLMGLEAVSRFDQAHAESRSKRQGQRRRAARRSAAS